MNKYIYIVKIIYKDDFGSIVASNNDKAFLEKDDAIKYISELKAKEEVLKIENKICSKCTADFEKSGNPSCYKHSGMDPACLNEVYIYPYKSFEIEVLELG